MTSQQNSTHPRIQADPRPRDDQSFSSSMDSSSLSRSSSYSEMPPLENIRVVASTNQEPRRVLETPVDETPVSQNSTNPPTSAPPHTTENVTASNATTTESGGPSGPPGQPGPQPAQRVNIDQIILSRLTVAQLRDELTQQGIIVRGRALKRDLIAILLRHFQSGTRIQPFTEPLQQAIDSIQRLRRQEQLERLRRQEQLERLDRHERHERQQQQQRQERLRNRMPNIERVNRNSTEADPIPIPPITHLGNPYLLLSNNILDEIADERDVDIERGTQQERAARLYEYDSILPQWIERLKQVSLHQLRSLSRAQLYVYAALRSIQLNSFNGETMDTLRGIVRALILCPTIRETPPDPITPILTTQSPNTTELIAEITELLNQSSHGSLQIFNLLLRVYMQYPQVMRRLSHSLRTLLFSSALPNVNPNEAEAVIERIIQYPPRVTAAEYLLIRRLPPSSLTRALEYRQVSHDIVMFLSYEDCIFILSRGHLPPFSANLAVIRARYEELQTLPREIRDTLMALYRTAEETDPMVGVAKKEPVPLEAIIRLMLTHPISALAAHVGMIIPPHLESMTYFRNNILHYDLVIGRSPHTETLTLHHLMTWRSHEVEAHLRRYTDEELMQGIGAYINYASRQDLIANIMALRAHEGFFIPLVRNCRNCHTQLYSETRDPNLFLIAFGTLTQYFGYEIDELLMSFTYHDSASVTETRGDFAFHHPEDPRLSFTVAQIDQLHQLLLAWSHQLGINELVTRLNEGLMEARQKTDYDRQLLREFRRISKDQQLLIRDYLMGLFQAGMYMRRWEGPGYPYPQKSNQTENTKISPDANTLKSLNRVQQIVDRFDTSMKRLIYGEYNSRVDGVTGGLRIVEYKGQQADQRRGSISDLTYQVIKGDFCIRMASSRFVGTGSYYLRLFFNETIPDFDPTHVDRVY